jgi:hypothetical protein
VKANRAGFSYGVSSRFFKGLFTLGIKASVERTTEEEPWTKGLPTELVTGTGSFPYWRFYKNDQRGITSTYDLKVFFKIEKKGFLRKRQMEMEMK